MRSEVNSRCLPPTLYASFSEAWPLTKPGVPFFRKTRRLAIGLRAFSHFYFPGTMIIDMCCVVTCCMHVLCCFVLYACVVLLCAICMCCYPGYMGAGNLDQVLISSAQELILSFFGKKKKSSKSSITEQNTPRLHSTSFRGQLNFLFFR